MTFYPHWFMKELYKFQLSFFESILFRLFTILSEIKMKKIAIIPILLLIWCNVSYAEWVPTTNYILPDTIKVDDINLFKTNQLPRENSDFKALWYFDNEWTFWVNYWVVKDLIIAFSLTFIFVFIFLTLIVKTWNSWWKR